MSETCFCIGFCLVRYQKVLSKALGLSVNVLFCIIMTWHGCTVTCLPSNSICVWSTSTQQRTSVLRPCLKLVLLHQRSLEMCSCTEPETVKVTEPRQKLNNYLREVWSPCKQHRLDSMAPLKLDLSDLLWKGPPGQTNKHCWWRAGGGVGRVGNFALQVRLSTVEETCCLVTVMNDFAYPLIIAHSGAERSPLIKMSGGTAGLLHLLQNVEDPEASGTQQSGRSGLILQKQSLHLRDDLRSKFLIKVIRGGSGGSTSFIRWLTRALLQTIFGEIYSSGKEQASL